MSLLNVTVKKARFVGAQAVQWNSYVTLKVQHVKSTTVTVKGATPSWEQDFLFELNNLDTGLLIEVWNKGLIWDKAVGYHWLQLRDIHHSNADVLEQEGAGQWLSLEGELVMQDGEVIGTKTPTGHVVLIDARFEVPFAEQEGDEGVELQRKLEMLNSMLDQEARVEQGRRQHQYYIQSGVSEDSDYTSDVNYPVGQHPNSSASQFRSTANQLSTPQRSLDSSRENSYEKDDDYRNNSGYNNPGYQQYLQPYPAHGHHGHQNRTLPRTSQQQGYWNDPRETETDPLYYNSRPQPYKPSNSYRNRGDSWNEQSQEGYGYKDPTGSSAAPYYDYDEAQNYTTHPGDTYGRRLNTERQKAPSLERQDTLYDDGSGDYPQTTREESNTRTQYANDRYSYGDTTAFNQKDSAYNQYPQNSYGYGEKGAYYSEEYTATDQTASNTKYNTEYTYDDYNYDDGTWDQTNTTTTLTNKRTNELPQPKTVPTTSSLKSTPAVIPSKAPTSTATTSAAAPTYPNILVTKHDEKSKYEANYYGQPTSKGNQVVPTSSSIQPKTSSAAVVSSSTSGYSDPAYQDPSTSYENQTGYEDWSYQGYYDESGNWIQYEQTGYYDEAGNWIDTTGQYYDYETGMYYSAEDYYGEYSYDEKGNVVYANYSTAATTTTTITSTTTAASTVPAVSTTHTPKTLPPIPTSATKTSPSKTANGKPLTSQSSVEYNYAYQSSENLHTAPGEKGTANGANSLSRRASFRRQASTRDYGIEGPPVTFPSSKSSVVTSTPATSISKGIEPLPSISNKTQEYPVDETGYSYDEQMAWDGQYGDSQYYEQYDEHGNLIEDMSAGPVHMDSIESNTSDTIRDPEAQDKFEAQYWQKQRERIAKQSSITVQDTYSYDPYSGGNILEPMDKPPTVVITNGTKKEISIEPRKGSVDDWASSSRNVSLDQDGYYDDRDRLGIKKDMLSFREESMERTIGDDEYLEDEDEIPQRGRTDSVDSANLEPTSPPRSPKNLISEIKDDKMIDGLEERKSSLEVPVKEGKKTVSFDEEPPKVKIIERVTKGMTPREKWLWSMNRICAQLAVSFSFLFLSLGVNQSNYPRHNFIFLLTFTRRSQYSFFPHNFSFY